MTCFLSDFLYIPCKYRPLISRFIHVPIAKISTYIFCTASITLFLVDISVFIVVLKDMFKPLISEHPKDFCAKTFLLDWSSNVWLPDKLLHGRFSKIFLAFYRLCYTVVMGWIQTELLCRLILISSRPQCEVWEINKYCKGHITQVLIFN